MHDDYTLSADDIEIMRLGREYEALVKAPAWALILNWLEKRSDAALTAHKLCESSDLVVSHGIKMRWRCTDEALTELQRHVYGAVERKRVFVQTLLDSGITPTQLETALSVLPPTVS